MWQFGRGDGPLEEALDRFEGLLVEACHCIDKTEFFSITTDMSTALQIIEHMNALNF
jgi:hypothetical protein